MNNEIKIEEIFNDLPSLKTERLVLRKMKMDDARDLFEYARDSEVIRYVTWDAHKSMEDSKDFLKMILDKYSEGEPADWGIIYRKNDKLIGTCGFFKISKNHRYGEIGYALSRDYWGRGLMTEAISAVIKFGFEKLKLNRIQARCLVENVASEKVLKKIGMKEEGILRESMFIKGRFRDLKMFSILKKEF